MWGVCGVLHACSVCVVCSVCSSVCSVYVCGMFDVWSVHVRGMFDVFVVCCVWCLCGVFSEMCMLCYISVVCCV